MHKIVFITALDVTVAMDTMVVGVVFLARQDGIDFGLVGV
jgi:hypothetical protein